MKSKDPTFDIAVIGAGVFGAWTAYHLKRSGAEVVLVDAYGPGNSRASSGGESRIMRLGYGPDSIYTRLAQRALVLWQDLFERVGDILRSPLFHPTGVLWLARDNDPYCEATLTAFEQIGIRYERLDRDQLTELYPQLVPGPSSWGILELDGGVLMARRAVEAVVERARAAGVTYLQEAVLPPNENGPLSFIETVSGRKIFAGSFIFACGPWLPKLFPALLGELIHITRQEVFFFGVPAGDDRFEPQRLPAWIDFNDLVYGIPNLDHRGFKIAIDRHGPAYDPDTGDRVTSIEGLAEVRAYLATRMSALYDAPVTETRVCQYENTSNGDFLVDRHPAFENVWLVGGGSGHGFKHGPAVGERVASLVSGDAQVEVRFSLASKERVQQRKVY